MNCIWMIVNPHSGSFNDTAVARLSALAAADGGPGIARILSLGDDALPTGAQLAAAAVDLLILFTGDGTASGAVDALGCAANGAADGPAWRGAVLVLPGGTLNLLSKHLHGDRAADAILADVLAGGGGDHRMTMVENAAGGPGDAAADVVVSGLVGVIAGPTTAWGDVRETLRQRDIAGLTQAVPLAVSETLGGDPVRLAGSADSYPAIYVEPVGGRLRLLGFTAGGAGELLSHGFAWLGGDFRNGPHVPLGLADTVEIVSDAATIGLLVDGERGHARAPLRLRATLSPLRFVRTITADAGRETAP